MNKLVSILIALLFFQNGWSQENAGKKNFLFENPLSKEKIRIETGNRIAIQFKAPRLPVTGIVLFIADSSLIVGVQKEPYRQIVSFRSIAKIRVLKKKPIRYIVRIMLISGEVVKGELAGTTLDSVSIMNAQSLQRVSLGMNEIVSIRIRGKKALKYAIGFGAGGGAILGALIGYASWSPSDCNDPGQGIFCEGGLPDPIYGAAAGAAIGIVAGALIGSSEREFKIEGKQDQFDLFANEFK